MDNLFREYKLYCFRNGLTESNFNNLKSFIENN